MSRPFVFYTTRNGGFKADCQKSGLPPSRLLKPTPLRDVLSSGMIEKASGGMALHSKIWGTWASLRALLDESPEVEAKKPAPVGGPHDPLAQEPLPSFRRVCPVHGEVLDSSEENGDNLLCPKGKRRGGRAGHWVSQWELRK